MAEPVLFVTQHYAPEEIGSGPYCTDIAAYLYRQGRIATVLTGWPHYPDAARFTGFRADDGRPSGHDEPGIVRLRHWMPSRRSVAGRIISEVLFLLGGLRALLTRRIHRHELVLSLCPSIFAAALGQAATTRGGRHLIVVHDIQSGLAGGLGMVRFAWLLRLMRLVERIVLNRADGLIVLSEDMRTRLRQMGIRVAIDVLPIWVDTTEIRPRPHRERPAPVLLYSGNLGRKQGLGQVLDLAERLARSYPGMTIILRGGGGERTAMEAAIAARNLTNVQLADLVPRDRLAEGLADGDIHLVPQNPDGADFAIPSKIYGILAAGRSFVTTALPGSALWRLAAETSAFSCVPPNDPAAFEAAVLRLAGDDRSRTAMEENGRRHIEQCHDRDSLLARLDGMLTVLSRDGELPRQTSLLVLEPDSNGHSREWLGHIIDQAAGRADLEILWLVLAPALCAALRDRIRPQDSGRIRLVSLTAAEERGCLHRRLAVSGFRRWWVMRRYLGRTGATVGYFLALDHLSLPFALGLGAMGRRVGGILFRPSVHYPGLGPGRRKFRERLRDLRKSVLYRLMLLNRSLVVVLSLDPFFPDFAAESYRGGHKVMALPDPAFMPSAGTGKTLAGLLPPPGRKLFLLFGALSARKGLLCLLEALCFVPAATAAGIAVVIAGKVDPSMRAAVRRAMARLHKRQPQLWLHLEDRWLEEIEIAGLVRASDVVLAPYQRFVGSSGVLLWAAQAGVPVLTQDYGLIARLVRDHRLGLAADVTDPRILADAIARMAQGDIGACFDPEMAKAFAASRSPDSFAAMILATAQAA